MTELTIRKKNTYLQIKLAIRKVVDRAKSGNYAKTIWQYRSSSGDPPSSRTYKQDQDVDTYGASSRYVGMYTVVQQMDPRMQSALFRSRRSRAGVKTTFTIVHNIRTTVVY